jgi:hypothetical protein
MLSPLSSPLMHAHGGACVLCIAEERHPARLSGGSRLPEAIQDNAAGHFYGKHNCRMGVTEGIQDQCRQPYFAISIRRPEEYCTP